MITIPGGLLVAIEGVDGSGKSTLTRNLVSALCNYGYPCMGTREPGDTQLGACIRDIIHNGHIHKTPKAEFLLFAADRAEHMATKVLPALRDSFIVISDRMGDSSIVYQGYARNRFDDIPMFEQVDRWVTEARHPDIVVYLRVTLDIARERIRQRHQTATPYESKEDYLAACIDGFERHMTSHPNASILDGMKTPEELVVDCIEVITRWLQQKKLID